MSKIVHIKRKDLELIAKIGEGGYGTVYHMTWRKTAEETVHVAAKKTYEVDKTELDILSRLSHPNIVSLIGVVPEEIDFMLILELCEGGSLRSYLNLNDKRPLSDELFKIWSKQAAKAIQYLNHMKIVHKDIKCDNYLITNDKILKLADFGLAKEIEHTLSNATESGTWSYMAPELLKDNKLSSKLDVFAYAVMLWEMLTGKIPYDGMTYHEIIWHVCRHNKRLAIPLDCPQHLEEVLRVCWQEDHKKRPSIDKVLFMLDKTCIVNSWTLDLQFAHTEAPGKLYQACSVAIHNKTNDIAVNDIHTSQVNIYTQTGAFKTSLGPNKTPQGPEIFHKSPRSVAAAAEPNCFFATDESHYVKLYDTTKHESVVMKFTPYALDNTPCGEGTWVGGLTGDTKDDLLVGVCSKGVNFISRHTQNGHHINSIPISILPMNLSTTPLNTIIVSSLTPNTVQIIDMTGRTLHTLDPPPCVTSGRWRPTGVCCHDNHIFVANDNQSVPDEFGIYCYSLTCEFLGKATPDVVNPTGVAITEDGERLLVAQYDLGNPTGGQGLHGVKVFKKSHNY